MRGTLLILSLASCHASPMVLAHRLCDDRVGVRVAGHAPDHLRAAVARAVRYWALDVGTPTLFLDSSIAVVSVVPDDDIDALATVSRTLRGGCVYAAMVRVSPRALRLSPERLETVVRHELGHVLGLQHDIGLSVMHPSVRDDDWPEHPQGADARQIEMLRRAYR